MLFINERGFEVFLHNQVKRTDDYHYSSVESNHKKTLVGLASTTKPKVTVLKKAR